MSNVVSINVRVEWKIEQLLASLPEDILVRIAKQLTRTMGERGERG